MRKKQLMEYCKTIEERNLRLRRELDETKKASEDIQKIWNAILFEIVKKCGEIEIDLPVPGNEVSFMHKENTIRISKKDAQEPDKSCGEKCQEKDITNEP